MATDVRKSGQYGNLRSEVDPERRAIGDQVRKLRMARGMTQRDLAEAMSRSGHVWTVDTVGTVQTGRRRNLTPRELHTLCGLLEVSVDDFLHASLGVPEAAPLSPTRDLEGREVRWVDNMPPFASYKGQREEIEELADRLGVTRNEMCRRLWAMSIPIVRQRLDQ